MAKLNPLRWGEGRQAKKTQKLADEVIALEDEYAALSDEQLKAKTGEFRARLEKGEELDDLLFEAFATVRESAWRVLGQKPYPVQVFGGIVLHQGSIAEMKTGEGKTLTSTMPVYLNALTGKGVHVVTVNEYLASRDAEWMGRVHNWLGLTVGLVHSQQSKESKIDAYRRDITYGTTNEFGFDYLRDNMAWEKRLQTQRGHHFALVDEVDSILIDEARTPLIISGPAEQSAQLYQVFARRVVPNLKKGEEIVKPGGIRETTGDYTVDEGKRTVGITEEGVEKVEKILGIDNMYESVNTPLIHHLNNALKAKELFKRDKEYIVANGEVKIVDESTGRVLEGRRYSEGLHQAIEAKENVKIKEENQTLATITLQNYYRTYDKLAGMTGTAKTEEIEFLEIYELGVVEVPTHRPIARNDQADLIYKTEKAKFEAVVDDIVERHENQQPVLVGTTSVEKSELVSRMLKQRGVKHNVLNAKFHEREAHVVAQAGQPGAVTVSTNMAGRGTDIILGGNAEELAKDEVAKLGPDATDEEKAAKYEEALARYESGFAEANKQVLDAGGLYVIGTERHESRRVDNQLRGRSGRQGDPGESRFFLSLQDDLMRLFNAAAVESIMNRLQIPEDVPIEHKMVTRAVANAQRQVESRNFDIRKNVLKYDDVMNEQRKVVYGNRQKFIEGDADEIGELAQRYVDEAIEDAMNLYAPPGVFPEDWDLGQLEDHVKRIYDCTYDFAELDLEETDRDELLEALIDDVDKAYEAREEEVGGEKTMREVERRVLLSVLDRKWREHLYEMDALRDGIGLRAVGQRDPLTEYQREAFDSFVAMMHGVKEEAVTYFFRLPVNQEGQGGQGGQQAAPAQQPGQQPRPAFGGGQPVQPAGQAQQPAAQQPAAQQPAAPQQPAASGGSPQVSFTSSGDGGSGAAKPAAASGSYSFGLAKSPDLPKKDDQPSDVTPAAPAAPTAPASPAAPEAREQTAPTDAGSPEPAPTDAGAPEPTPASDAPRPPTPSPAPPPIDRTTPPVDATAEDVPPQTSGAVENIGQAATIPTEPAPPAPSTEPTAPTAPEEPAPPADVMPPDAIPASPDASSDPAPSAPTSDPVSPPLAGDGPGQHAPPPSAPQGATEQASTSPAETRPGQDVHPGQPAPQDRGVDAAPAAQPPAAQPQAAPPAEDERPDVGIEMPSEPQNLTYSSSSATNAPSGGASDADVTVRDDGTHVRRVASGEQYTKGDDAFASAGRNDPCPCGSGRKYKKCHGAPT